MEGITAMAGWINTGEVKVEETVTEGFENTPNAFMGLFTGENTGKMIVKV
jgi:NADPH-dependent curcumin reductase CurA